MRREHHQQGMASGMQSVMFGGDLSLVRALCILLFLVTVKCREENKIDEVKKLRVLLLSPPMAGHLAPLLSLSSELVNRGHEMTLSVGTTEEKLAKYSDLASRNNLRLLHFIFTEEEGFGNAKKGFSSMSSAMIKYSAELVRNLIEPLENGTYDVILGEDFVKTSLLCIHSRWRVPIVHIGTTLPLLGAPSSWPTPGVMFGGSSDKLSFAERFASTVEKITFPTLIKMFLFSPQHASTRELCPSLTLREVLEPFGVEHPFISQVAIGFEYPRSIYPLTHFIGPLISKNPIGLSEYPDIAEWLSTKKPKSVVYLSTGTLFDISREKSKALLEGVMATNYSLFWCLRKDNHIVLEGLDIDRSRVFIMSWGPQFSVLSSAVIHSAILHGGFNSVVEALWNEVPVIGLPQMQEQAQVIFRVHHYGFGLNLGQEPLLSSKVSEAITSIDNGGYRSNLKKLKKLFLMAGGVERAVDLVEMYVDVGYSHLVPAYIKYEWTWVQYYNVDVWLLFASGVLLAFFLCHRFLRCLWNCCKKEKLKIT